MRYSALYIEWLFDNVIINGRPEGVIFICGGYESPGNCLAWPNVRTGVTHIFK
jgi:hypothetical protein